MITITTPTQLQNMANDLTEDYVLGADIDLTGVDWTPVGAPWQLIANGTTTSDVTNKLIDSTADFITDGVQVGDRAYANSGVYTYVVSVDDLHTLTMTKDYWSSGENYDIHRELDGFTGTLDGNGYTISNLTLSVDYSWRFGQQVGLFSKTTDGSLTDVVLTDVSFIEIFTDNWYDLRANMGSLSGECHRTTLSGCSATGIFDLTYGAWNVGGLVGLYEVEGNCSITNCWTNIEMTLRGNQLVTTFIDVGGLIAEVVEGDVNSNVDIYGNMTMSNCYTTGNIHCNKAGIIGCGMFISEYNPTESIVSDCYATGSFVGERVTTARYSQGIRDIAGFMSYCGDASPNRAYMQSLYRCYATGDITITSSQDCSASGFISYLEPGIIEDCYYTGDITMVCTGDYHWISAFGFYEDLESYANDFGGEYPDDNRRITGCYSTSNISATATDPTNPYGPVVYGFGGYAFVDSDDFYIYDCHHEGTLYASGKDCELSGFISYWDSGYSTNGGNYLQKCYHEGDMTVVSSDSYLCSGFISEGYMYKDSLIKDCYTKGALDISGAGDDGKIGGFFGDMYFDGDGCFLANVYSEVDINISTEPTNWDRYIGGFAGYLYGYQETSTNPIINVGSIGLVTVAGGTDDYWGGFIGYLGTDNGLSDFNFINCSYWSGSYAGNAIGTYWDGSDQTGGSLESFGYGSDCPTKISFLYNTYHMYNISGNTYGSQSGRYDFHNYNENYVGNLGFPSDMLPSDYAIWEQHITTGVYPDFRLEDIEAPTPVRYEPSTEAGCPKCGTFLYMRLSDDIFSRAKNAGLNATRHSDKFVRCGHCGFICKLDRDTRRPDGDRSGDGLNHTAIYEDD